MIDSQLKLQNIRNMLIRQEETIIFALIERAQYKTNCVIYDPSAFEITDFTGSFCDFYLYKSDCVDSLIRRFTAPDQYPFFTDLPEPILPTISPKSPIIETGININGKLKDIYVKQLVPYICEEGDDGQYGSGVLCDKVCLRALSARIHYGMFVAESKFLNQTDEYMLLINAGDREGIMDLLTDSDVEERLLARVKKKAQTYGQDPGDIAKNYKIEPLHVVDIYRRWIIPLTKDVEVDYLMIRGKEYSNV